MRCETRRSNRGGAAGACAHAPRAPHRRTAASPQFRNAASPRLADARPLAQAFIAAIERQPHGVANPEVLDTPGLEVGIDRGTGKVQLVRTEAGSAAAKAAGMAEAAHTEARPGATQNGTAPSCDAMAELAAELTAEQMARLNIKPAM